jgi:hypothetical protein
MLARAVFARLFVPTLVIIAYFSPGECEQTP